MRDSFGFDRRRFLQMLLALPAAFAALTRFQLADEASAAEALFAASAKGGARRPLAPTPDCDDHDEPTPFQTQGPFFTPQSPLRKSLVEPGMAGSRIVVTGRVLTQGCKPVAGALLDFWHSDNAGEYDNEGFRCRGHQYTDAQGQYRLETIVPGLYPGRTRHFHAKVQAPKGRVLTTQLYFPREPQNASDGLFDPALLMWVRDASAARDARFNFVLRA